MYYFNYNGEIIYIQSDIFDASEDYYSFLSKQLYNTYLSYNNDNQSQQIQHIYSQSNFTYIDIEDPSIQ